MDDFRRIRATETVLERHHFASLGEAQERLSPLDFAALMREISAIVAAHVAADAPARRVSSWWGRKR